MHNEATPSRTEARGWRRALLWGRDEFRPAVGSYGRTAEEVSVDERDRVPARSEADPAGLRSAELVVYGPIVQGDIPGLCTRVRSLLDDGPDRIVCDVADIIEPDGATLDALARLQLAARRRGCQVVLRHAGIDLLGLLDAAGLGEIVPLAD